MDKSPSYLFRAISIKPKCHVMTTDKYSLKAPSQKIIKYFPKYIQCAVFEQKSIRNGRFALLIKRIKSIKSITFLKPDAVNHFLILLLIKAKSHYLKHVYGTRLQFLPNTQYIKNFSLDVFDFANWRLFLKLRELRHLNIFFGTGFFEGLREDLKRKVLKKIRWRLKFHLCTLKNMQNLSIEYSDSTRFYAYVVLMRLNEIVLSLRNLRGLKISVAHRRDGSIDGNNMLLKNVFASTTNLAIDNILLISYDYFLKSLKHFHNLISLKLVIRCQEEEKQTRLWGFDRMKYVAELKNLRTLDLMVFFNSKKALLSYFKNLCLPKAIESVNFAICNFAWETLFSERTISIPKWQNNPFEHHEIFSEFYNKWEGLEKLTFLKFYIADQSNYSNLNEHFLVPLIKRLPKLATLYYVSKFHESSQKLKVPLDLSYFWQGIKHLGLHLKKIHIEDFAISLRKFKGDEEFLPALKEIKLWGYVLGDEKFKALLNMQSKVKCTCSNPELNVKELVLDKKESFRKILKFCENIPRNLTLFLTLNARKIPPQIIKNELSDFLPKAKIKGDFSLSIKETAKFESDELREINQKLEQFPLFKRFSIEIRHQSKVVLDTQNQLLQQTFGWDDDEDDETCSLESFDELRDKFNHIDFNIAHKFSHIVDI